MLAHGFAWVCCESCKDELLVALACKVTGWVRLVRAYRREVAVEYNERLITRAAARPTARLIKDASEERDIECNINNAPKPPRQAIRRLMA